MAESQEVMFDNKEILDIEKLSWYKEFLGLVESCSSNDLKDIFEKFRNQFFYSIEQEDLFKLVYMRYYPRLGENGITPAQLAKAILWRFAHLLDDKLLEKYSPFVHEIAAEKARRIKEKDVMFKYFPQFSRYDD